VPVDDARTCAQLGRALLFRPDCRFAPFEAPWTARAPECSFIQLVLDESVHLRRFQQRLVTPCSFAWTHSRRRSLGRVRPRQSIRHWVPLPPLGSAATRVTRSPPVRPSPCRRTSNNNQGAPPTHRPPRRWWQSRARGLSQWQHMTRTRRLSCDLTAPAFATCCHTSQIPHGRWRPQS
jgi:hypothetical protein